MTTNQTTVCAICPQTSTQHVCQPCLHRLALNLTDIPRLVAEGYAWQPLTNGTSSGTPVWESKPPMALEALDPECITILLDRDNPDSAVTIITMLEAWERRIRHLRGLTPYGPVSHARTQRGIPTLTGTTRFLKAALPWIATHAAAEAGFDARTFHRHLNHAVAALQRFDPDTQHGYMVRCPTLTDTATCAYRLRFYDTDTAVNCPRCGASRTAAQLIRLGLADDTRAVWADPDTAAHHYHVPVRELRRLAAAGRIQRSHGLYLLSTVQEAITPRKEA